VPEFALLVEGCQRKPSDSASPTEGEKSAEWVDARTESGGRGAGNGCPIDDGPPFSRQRSSSRSMQSATGRMR
jgi:hypothetical protein